MQDKFYEQAVEQGVRDMRGCPWVKDELGGADFGDQRLRPRFLVIAQSLSRFPQAFISQASELWPRAKAAYRFFDNKRVTARCILTPHYVQAAQRIKNQSEPVLILQDSSYLNYSHMTSSTDLGTIGRFPEACMGLIMHTSLAVTEHGLPLGIVNQEVWARSKVTMNASAKRHRRIEERESFIWLKSLREYHKRLSPYTNVVTICDRGGDIYEVFREAFVTNTQFLIRSRGDRLLANNKYLWAFVQKKPPVTRYTVHVQAQENSPSRDATVEVRFCSISIPAPKHNAAKDNPKAIAAWAVYVSEINPSPQVEEPIEWMLITNVPTNTTREALTRIKWYTCRWMIEVFHKVLKSGCHVEYSRLAKNSRRIPFLALKSIIAWKLLLLTYFQRVSPEEPASALLSEIECRALYVAIHNILPNRLRISAKTVTRWLAQLGGFLGRKYDGQPGVTAIWRGWHRLQDFTRILAAVES